MSDSMADRSQTDACDANLDWRMHGACVELDPDDFFPIGNERTSARQYEHARLVCRECPVSTQCLQFALDSAADFGMWGGFTPRERQRMRSRREHADEDRRNLFGPRATEPQHEGDDLSVVHTTDGTAVRRVRARIGSAR